MQTVFATANTPGRVNEDYAVCGPGWAVMLDGATAPPHIDSGCIHDVPWLVRHLASGITRQLVLDNERPLADVLADAIAETRHAHEDTCDLANPDSPSSTVSIVRTREGHCLDYLALGDSPLILRTGQQIQAIKDDRTDHLPGGRPYSYELITRMRNADNGFWVASTNIDAAYHAVCGSTANVTDLAMLTDGATRLVDFYGYTWDGLFRVVAGEGPAEIIRRVRVKESAAPPPHGKMHDDVTALYACELFQDDDALEHSTAAHA